MIPIGIDALETICKVRLEDWISWISEDHPNYWIVEIGQNTKKSFGDLRRLSVTQSPVKDNQQ